MTKKKTKNKKKQQQASALPNNTAPAHQQHPSDAPAPISNGHANVTHSVPQPDWSYGSTGRWTQPQHAQFGGQLTVPNHGFQQYQPAPGFSYYQPQYVYAAPMQQYASQHAEPWTQHGWPNPYQQNTTLPYRAYLAAAAHRLAQQPSVLPGSSRQYHTEISPTPAPRGNRAAHPWQRSARVYTQVSQVPTPDPGRDPLVLKGSIPKPSNAYTAHVSGTSLASLTEPKRLLIILDLNGVLIHRPSGKGRPQSYRPRPALDSFLSYCFAHHRVMVWTSTRKANAEPILAKLLTADQRAALLAVWTRESFGLSKEDFNARTQVFKRLSQVWDDQTLNPQREWGIGNTLLLDDSPLKAAAEPWNLVHVPEWAGKDGGDRHLAAAMATLQALALVSDVAVCQWTQQREDKEDGGVKLS